MGYGPSKQGPLLCVQTNGDKIWLTNRKKEENIVVVCYRFQGGQPTHRIGRELIAANSLVTKEECRMDVIDDHANKEEQGGKIEYKFMAWPEDEDTKEKGQAKKGLTPEIITLAYKKGEMYYKYRCPHMFLEAEQSKGAWEAPDALIIEDVRSKCETVIIGGKEVRAEKFAAFAAQHLQEFSHQIVAEQVGEGICHSAISWKLGEKPADKAFDVAFNALTREFTCTICKQPWHAAVPVISTTICPDCRPECKVELQNRVKPASMVPKGS